MRDTWTCPGCGTMTSDPHSHVEDCDKVDGAGNTICKHTRMTYAGESDEVGALIIDVTCLYCGMSGSLIITPDDVSWE